MKRTVDKLDPDSFKRSAKGNLWTRHRKKTLVVFKRPDEKFSWLIAGGEDKVWSDYSYEEEEEALRDLQEYVADYLKG
jgi:hypothetical protein